MFVVLGIQIDTDTVTVFFLILFWLSCLSISELVTFSLGAGCEIVITEQAQSQSTHCMWLQQVFIELYTHTHILSHAHTHTHTYTELIN